MYVDKPSLPVKDFYSKSSIKKGDDIDSGFKDWKRRLSPSS